MSAYSPLSPVSVGVYAALNVPALTAVAPGGVHDDVPQNTTFPYVQFGLSESNASAFGATAGSGPGSLSEVALRCAVYSQYGGMLQCQNILAQIKALLRTPPALAGGYICHAIFFHDAVPIGDDIVAGVKVKELAANWSLWVEEAA